MQITSSTYLWAMKSLIFLTCVGGCLWLHAQKPDPFAPVNSVYDEQAPVLSPDGRVLYFTVANHPLNVGGKKDPGDVWFCVRMGDQWSAPVHGGSVINDRGYNAVGALSADGEKLYLLGHYGTGGAAASTQGIAVAQRAGDGWGRPMNISIPYFLNREAMLSGSFNADQTVFVFAAESYATIGAEDLYVTFFQNGRWSEPRSLGRQINTAFQELSPSLSADAKMLYFATNGRKGYGSFDVYYAERLDDTWTRWSTPVNMGSRINSEARELFYQTYPPRGFSLYTSTRNSDGYGDIKSYYDSLPPLASQPPDTAIRMMEITREPGQTNKLVRLSGRVQSTATAEPLIATIVFKSSKVYSVTTNKEGQYNLTVPSTDVYAIQVSAPGHVNTLEQLDIHTYEMETLELNFRLQPIAVGTTVNLKSVLFKISTTELLPESYPELDVVADFLKTNPKVEIELHGHTDNRGDPRKNLQLSKDRVETVKRYLASKGVSAKRIRGKGYGGSRPIASGDSEESRRLNRRVEFTILKN